MAMTQAVILAAGKSTRTYPLTVEMPKPLLPVMNKPLLEHNLEALQGVVKEAIIVVGFKKELIMERFGKKFGSIALTYVEQKQQLGTGHALMLCKERIKGEFILMNGDDLYAADDIRRCVNAGVGVLGGEVDDHTKFGMIIETKGKLKEIVEKPAKPVSKIANTGLYVLPYEIFSLLEQKKSKRGEYEVVGAVTALAKRQKVIVKKVKEYWLPIGYPWDLLAANEALMKRISAPDIKGVVEKLSTIKGVVRVGGGTTIKNGAYIEGPVVIGKDCIIGPNCYIRAYSCIGNGCKVANASEVKNSILMDKAAVNHLTYIGDSILGERVNIGGGTITANLRHDHTTIFAMVNGQKISTGRRKLGAILANDVHTGIHTSFYPGRMVWPHMTTLPGENVRKNIMPKKMKKK